MVKDKVVVYGLSTEGYYLACQMASKGADVHIIDESSSSAISLKPETAKTYPSVASLQGDEPLLSMKPIDVAISEADYLFFTPRIRKVGQDLKTEINSKFKDAVGSLKKGSSIVYCIPTGFGGNNENMSLLKHVTGFDAGKSISYYYFPINDINSTPQNIGSLKNTDDKKLSSLLSTGKQVKKFIDISSAEYIHGINIIKKFSGMCSILEVCKFVNNNIEAYVKDILLPEMKKVYPKANIEKEIIGEIIGFTKEEKSDAVNLVCNLTGDNSRDVVSFGTEAGLFQELGISTVVCGPGSIEQAHTIDEYVSFDQLKLCLKMLIDLKEQMTN